MSVKQCRWRLPANPNSVPRPATGKHPPPQLAVAAGKPRTGHCLWRSIVDIMQCRDGLRMLRSAPAFGIADTAAAARIETRALRSAMRRLKKRGRCAAALTAADRHGSLAQRVAVLSHRACPPAVIRATGAIWSNSARFVAAPTAAWAEQFPPQNTSRGRVVTVAASGGPNALIQVTRTASAVLLVCHLSDHPNPEIRAAATANAACPSATLAHLSEDSNYQVCEAVAAHPNCPAAALERLAGDIRHSDIFAAVATHANCPVRLLERLSRSPDETVRRPAAAHPDCPAATLERLSTDHNDSVRVAVAEHQRCPPAVLERFDTTTETAAVRIAVAKHRSCPAAVLEDLSEDLDARVRLAIARHPRCTAAALERLSEDFSGGDARIAVAEHPNCPTAVLERLSEDRDYRVSSTAGRSPALRRSV